MRADSKTPDLYEDQLKENYDKEVIEGVGTSKEQYELERLREFVDEFYEICTRPKLIDVNLQFTFLFCQADFHVYDRNPTREGLVWLLYYCKTIIQNPKYRTESGLGLVDLAIERSSSRVLETLLAEGADPHYHNSDQITPLARAIRKDDQRKIFLIVKYMNMQPKSAPSLIIDSKPETQAAVTESEKLIPGQFEIDMSITLNWQKSEARSKAIAQLKERLTQEEIKTLSKYLAEIVDLETSIQTQLINTIQNGRISAKDDLDFGSGTCDSNYFAENLKTLLDNGVILEDFAKMSQKDQEGFALKADFIGLLLKNGIDFDVLTYLSVSDLASFHDFLTTHEHISKYELLHSKDTSPEKARAIEFVSAELNSRAQTARKLKN